MLLAVWMEPPVHMGKPVWSDVLEWCQLSPEDAGQPRSGEAEPALSLRIWIAWPRRKWHVGSGWLRGFPRLSRRSRDRGRSGWESSCPPDGRIDGGDQASIVTATEGVVLAAGTGDASAQIEVAIERIGVAGSIALTSDEAAGSS